MSISQFSRIARLTGLVLVLSGLGLVSACGIFSPDETDKDGGQPPVTYENPATPDALIRNFVKAWNARDFLAYDQLRHTDFLFEFASADIGASGTPNGIWVRQRDTDATQKMFQGQPGQKGEIVQSIELTLHQKSAGWVPATEPEFAGTLKKTYDVDMRVTMTNSDIYNIDGEQDFYAIDVAADGEPPRFVLYYWRDLGIEG
jgi:hypothetical protein